MTDISPPGSTGNSTIEPELVYDVRAELGEGPLWDDRRGRLLFLDIKQRRVHAFDPLTRDDRVFTLDRLPGAIACTTRGDWVIAAGTGFVRLDPDSGQMSVMAEAAPGRDDLRMNDGYVDAVGRFWAGTLSLRHEPGQASLYRLDPDGRVQTMLAPVTNSNGLDWSPDNRLMYYVDTGTKRVDVFDFDLEHGAIGNRRPFVQFGEGPARPDGLIVDADGGVWVALYEGGEVRRYCPDGSLDLRVELPVTFTTKCAFGGAALDELYVTSGRASGTTADPRDRTHAGGVYRLRPGRRGKPVGRFRG